MRISVLAGLAVVTAGGVFAAGVALGYRGDDDSAGDLGLPAADFRDVSCGGATIADLSGSQSTDDGTNPAQLSALSPATRLVTLGIGGNDIGFTALIKNCVKAGILFFATSGNPYAGDAPCREEYVTGRTDAVRQKIDAAGQRLAGALTDIARRAPRARVYVVGYPAILPATSSPCGREVSLAPAT